MEKEPHLGQTGSAFVTFPLISGLRTENPQLQIILLQFSISCTKTFSSEIVSLNGPSLPHFGHFFHNLPLCSSSSLSSPLGLEVQSLYLSSNRWASIRAIKTSFCLLERNLCSP